MGHFLISSSFSVSYILRLSDCLVFILLSTFLCPRISQELFFFFFSGTYEYHNVIICSVFDSKMSEWIQDMSIGLNEQCKHSIHSPMLTVVRKNPSCFISFSLPLDSGQLLDCHVTVFLLFVPGILGCKRNQNIGIAYLLVWCLISTDCELLWRYPQFH